MDCTPLYIRHGKDALTPGILAQLVEISATDPLVDHNTSDPERFCDADAILRWAKQGRHPVSFTDADGTLLAFGWTGPKSHPDSQYENTIAMRIYGELRGKGLAGHLFGTVMQSHLSLWPETKGFWGEAHSDNIRSIQMCKRIGLHEVKAGDTSVVLEGSAAEVRNAVTNIFETPIAYEFVNVENNSKNLAVIILAAGKGTRMQSDLPKSLHKIAGKPMLGHILSTAEALNPDKIILVAAPGQVELFKPHIGNHQIVVQQEQLGPGHAVICARNALQDFVGDILILYGDVPLIQSSTLSRLLDDKRQAESDTAVLAFHTEEPFGYGRLVIKNKNLVDIVEEKDATPAQQQITLCNASIMASSAPAIWDALWHLDRHNAQEEYALPKLVVLATKPIFRTAAPDEVMGVNTPEQLALAEQAYLQKGNQIKIEVAPHQVQTAPKIA